MSELTEIRWHGRGGQGAKTASDLVGKTAARMGKDIQAFPEYGPERMGAPVQAFNRISDEKFTIHCQIKNPDIVVVLDPNLIEVVDVTEGLSNDGIIIVNSKESSDIIKDKLNFSGNVWTVDAYEISYQEMGRPIPNTPLIGALIGVTNILDYDDFIQKIELVLAEKFSNEIVKSNLAAIKRAYTGVQTNES